MSRSVGQRSMRRVLLTMFAIWFCGFMIPIVLFLHYYLGFPFNGELIQLVVLASFTCLNFFYLLLRLYKIDLLAAVIFGVVFWGAGFFYIRFFDDIDPRLQSIHILAALIAITIVVHFVAKKWPVRRSSEE